MSNRDRYSLWKEEVKNESERILGEMLESFGLDLIYEQVHGGPKPEFSCYRDGKLVAVAEMKDLKWNDNEQIEWDTWLSERLAGKTGPRVRGFSPLGRSGRKLKEGAKKLQFVSAVPTVIVVRDSGIVPQFRLDNPIKMAELLIGPRCMIDCLEPLAEGREPRIVFTDSGFFLNQEALPDGRTKSEHRRVVSAVAVMRRAKTDSGEEVNALVIYCNPLAHVPWPFEFVGIQDQVWEFEIGNDFFKMSKTFDGLKPVEVVPA